MRTLLISLFSLFFILLSLSVSVFAKSEKANGDKVTVGDVKKVSGNTITLEEQKGKGSVNAQVDKTTKVVGQDRKVLRLSDIKTTDMVAIVSTDEAEMATDGAKIKKIKKVFVKDASSSAQLNRRAVMGIITQIEGLTLTLVHQIQTSRTYTVQVNPDAVIRIRGQGGGTFADLAVGQRIVAMGDLGDAGGIAAKLIHIIPGKAYGVFKKLPSPSATATASAEPTPTETASPSP